MTQKKNKSSFMATLHALIINLDKRKDRMDSISTHLSAEEYKNLMPQRIAAISGGTLSGSGVCAARACSLSHAKALKFAKEQKWPMVLVLEDDARLRENFSTSLETIFGELPEDWMVIFLGPGRAKKVTYHSPHLIRMCRGTDEGYLTGSHAILYSKTAYDLCIEALESPHSLVHTDLILSNVVPRESLFVPVPYMAEFICSVSDIRPTQIQSSAESGNLDLKLLQETETRLSELMRKYEAFMEAKRKKMNDVE